MRVVKKLIELNNEVIEIALPIVKARVAHEWHTIIQYAGKVIVLDEQRLQPKTVRALPQAYYNAPDQAWQKFVKETWGNADWS